jgi:hypothetical protein
MLNINFKDIIEIFEAYDGSGNYTICYHGTETSETGVTYRCKKWETVPKAEGLQMTEMLNKKKKEEEEYERRNGVSPEVARSRAQQQEREILRKVRGQEIFKGKPGGQK